MERTRLLLASNGLLWMTLLAVVAGCVPNSTDAPVLILYNKQPEGTSDGACTVSRTDDSSKIVLRGMIDVKAPYGYLFTPIVRNYAETGDSAQNEQRMALVEGADVSIDLRGLSGDSSLTAYSTRFSSVIPPNEGTAALLFEILPRELLAQLDTQMSPGDVHSVSANVKLFGSLGGGEFESQDFVYWIDVCDSCMVNDLGTCEGLAQSPTNTGGPCNPLQDAVLVDCCTSVNQGLLCPAVQLPPI